MSTATSRARVSPITAAHGSRLLPIDVCVRTAGVLRLKRSASASPLEVATGTVRVATKVKTSASRPCRRRAPGHTATSAVAVSYTHLRAHETPEHLVCRLLLEKK